MTASISRERFVNAATFLHAMDTRPVNKYWEGERRSSRESGRSDWRGTGSWEDALKLARFGYSDVLGQMVTTSNMTAKRIFSRVSNTPSRPKDAYVGGSPNVVRAIRGLPRDMRKMEFKQKKIPGITIVYEGSFNCSIGTDTIIDAGARVLALLKLCERAQTPVRLVFSDTNKGSNNQIAACEITVKEFSASLNYSKLAFYLAHPSVHRRLIFAWLETTHAVKEYSPNYFFPITNTRSDYEKVREHYAALNMSWFCFKDFASDDDVVRIYHEILSRNAEA